MAWEQIKTEIREDDKKAFENLKKILSEISGRV